jgi:hypothetical protein
MEEVIRPGSLLETWLQRPKTANPVFDAMVRVWVGTK